MNKNVKLEAMLSETGKMLNIGKDEIKYVLKGRKNVVAAVVIFAFAFFLIDGLTYGTLRYAGASINDFIQMGKFL